VVTADQVKIALCEALDIWPASIADDVIAHSPGDLALVLRQACPDELLKFCPVNNKVGNVRNNGAQLLIPV
jgi:hypothetical protein